MLKALVTVSLKLRGIVVILAILLMVVGFRTLPDTQLDVFPEFAPPLVEIQTEAPGLSTTEVESLVSTPIENTLNGLTSLKTLRSKSVLGLSSVVLIFDAGTDLMTARQLVQERLALAASRLPTVARAPVILSPLSSTSRVLKIGLKDAFANGDDRPGAVDDSPAPDGRAGRGERGDLGRTRPPVSGGR
jgi:Cu/Ag efflux pump CusA